jgi:K+-sensing histidine kinase KdpD
MNLNGTNRLWRSDAQFMFASMAMAILTFVCFRLQANLATTTLLYLIVVVLLSVADAFLASVFVSFIAVLLLDYYFVPPIFSLELNDPLYVAVLVTFLGTALLIARVRALRRQAEQALQKLARRRGIAESAARARARHSRDDAGGADGLDRARS